MRVGSGNDIEAGDGDGVEKPYVLGIGMARAKASGMEKSDAELRASTMKHLEGFTGASGSGGLDAGESGRGGFASGPGGSPKANAKIFGTTPEEDIGRFAKGMAVVGSAVNAARAVELLREADADVAVISAQLADGPLEGFRVLRELQSLGLKTRAILLFDLREPAMIVDAFRSGAHGVVIRDEPLETLCKCIRAVHQGQIWANSQELEYVLSALGQAKAIHVQDAKGAVLLSKREEDVVRLVAEGLTNREISRELKLSQHTVRNYLFHIFEKLGISSRVELVLYCLQNRTAAIARPEKRIARSGRL